jgi:hypothetical protein
MSNKTQEISFVFKIPKALKPPSVSKTCQPKGRKIRPGSKRLIPLSSTIKIDLDFLIDELCIGMNFIAVASFIKKQLMS